jgi:histidyl-tRNA synthetase
VSRQSRIAGVRDYVGSEALAFGQLLARVEAIFRSFAYRRVDPPILEAAAPFLDRSGEDIRRRMYVFLDPGGREICLRPEITIPACRLYLRHKAKFGREARISYAGPVFRYEQPSEGRYRQFHQAGIELIGATQREAADAEVAAVALSAIEGAGVREGSLVVGDLDIARGFIDALPIAPRVRARLHRLVWSEEMLHALAESGASQAATMETLISPELMPLLASLGTENARIIVSELLKLVDVRHVGGRAADDIAERLVTWAAHEGAEPISKELIEGVSALKRIRDKPENALRAIRAHARAFRVDGLDPILARSEERLRLLAAHHAIDPEAVVFDAGLRRGLAYYTSFVFEVYARNSTALGHICGGGRYDGLLEALGDDEATPAVGFALGLERLTAAVGAAASAGALSGHPEVLVVAAGVVPQEACIAAARAIRLAGFSVETELSGRRPRNLLVHALKREIPFLVFVGEEEFKRGEVAVKRLSDRNEHAVPLGELTGHMKEQRREADGGKL